MGCMFVEVVSDTGEEDLHLMLNDCQSYVTVEANKQYDKENNMKQIFKLDLIRYIKMP